MKEASKATGGYIIVGNVNKTTNVPSDLGSKNTKTSVVVYKVEKKTNGTTTYSYLKTLPIKK